MHPDLTVQGITTAIDGPLLFLRRNIGAGLNEAVEVLSSTAPVRTTFLGLPMLASGPPPDFVAPRRARGGQKP